MGRTLASLCILFVLYLYLIKSDGKTNEMYLRQIKKTIDRDETKFSVWSGTSSSLADCSVMCLHKSNCVSLLYDFTEASCKLFDVIYNADGSVGAEDVVYYTLESSNNRRVPESCQDLVIFSGAKTDGEYWIYPKATNGQRIKIYCHDMQFIPSEYITLRNTNYFIQHDQSNWQLKYIQCQSTIKPPLKTVHFSKVKINIQNMEIDGNDYQFTSLTGSPTVEYGQSTDCNGESFRNPCPRFSEAVIDTRGTGLIVDPTITWGVISGWWAKIENINRSTDGAQISFICTGWCGECGPTSGPIILQPSKEYISATDAKALVCDLDSPALILPAIIIP